MGKIILKRQNVNVQEGEQVKRVYLLKKTQLDSFNPNVLGLGNIGQRSSRVEAIAAVFDLSGFTEFCGQNDPQLCVPDFLNQFLTWLFDDIKTETINESYPDGSTLWCDLPFLAKFLGDGVLFLWDTDAMGETSICNVVVSLRNICTHYRNRFYPKIKRIVVGPPDALRCGIARGSVYSVGNAEDYIDPCINVASRLQKLSILNFCVSRKGFDLEKYTLPETYKNYCLKSVPLRGIGNNELVWIVQREFDALPPEEKKAFKEP